MKTLTIAWLTGLALAVGGCGSDSPAQVQPKDAAPGNKDTPAAGDDGMTSAESKDAPPPQADAPADVAAPADSKDVPQTSEDLINRFDAVADLALADTGDAAARDVADALAPVDSTLDVAHVDSGNGADAQAVDLSAQPSVMGFPCRDSADCCIAVDGCMNVSYLYSKGPGAAPPPSFSPPSNGYCTACIPPAIQVSCESGQCVGTSISSYPVVLLTNHCGTIPLADAGTHAPQKADAGTATTKSVWTCGGG
jgi:hypothetical protein